MIPYFYMCAGARCTGGSTGLPPWWLLVLLSVFVCGADFGNANNTGFQLHGNAFYLGWDLPYWDPIGFTNLRSADKTAHPISRVSNRLQHVHGNSIAMSNTGMHIIWLLLGASWHLPWFAMTHNDTAMARRGIAIACDDFAMAFIWWAPTNCHDASQHCHGGAMRTRRNTMDRVSRHVFFTSCHEKIAWRCHDNTWY